MRTSDLDRLKSSQVDSVDTVDSLIPISYWISHPSSTSDTVQPLNSGQVGCLCWTPCSENLALALLWPCPSHSLKSCSHGNASPRALGSKTCFCVRICQELFYLKQFSHLVLNNNSAILSSEDMTENNSDFCIVVLPHTLFTKVY